MEFFPSLSFCWRRQGCFSSPGLRHPSRCLDGDVSSRRPSHIFATFFLSLSLFLHPPSPVSVVSRFFISISGGKFPNASPTVAPSPSPVLFTTHTPLHRLTAASLSPLRNDTTRGEIRRDPRRRQRLLPSIPPLHPRCPTLHHTPSTRDPPPPPLLAFQGSFWLITELWSWRLVHFCVLSYSGLLLFLFPGFSYTARQRSCCYPFLVLEGEL